MKKIYNVGIIGTGDAAEEHYQAIKKNNNLLLKSFYTSNSKRGKLMQSKWKLKPYSSLLKMLKLEKLDIIVIANENFKHFKLIKDVIKYQVNILVEKPISHFFFETKEVIKLSKKNEKNVSVVFQKRFNSSYVLLKKILLTKSLGSIVMVNLKIFMPRDKKYFSKKKWLLGNRLNNQGIVMHHAIHMLDIVCWIFEKDIENVSCWMSNEILRLKIEDTCSGFFKFKNGPYVNFCISVCADQTQKNSIEIIGTNKTLIANDNELIDMTSNKYLTSKYLQNFKKNYIYGSYKVLWKNFIRSINSKKLSITDSSSTIITHKLIDKIYKQ